MNPWTGAFLSVVVVSALPLAVTYALARRETAVLHHLPKLSLFGAGVVLGAAVAHIIPEALRNSDNKWLVAGLIVLGYVAFWLVEKALAGHDHAHAHGVPLGAPSAHHDATSASECKHLHPTPSSSRRAIVPMAFAGDATHNVVDGMLIAAGFLTDTGIGFLTLLAVGLHELPREVGTFGLFVQGGIKPMRAVAYNLVTALLALVGAAVTLTLGSQVTAVATWLLPVAAGTYLYIAQAVGKASLHDTEFDPRHWPRLGWAAAGLALMVFTALV